MKTANSFRMVLNTFALAASAFSLNACTSKSPSAGSIQTFAEFSKSAVVEETSDCRGGCILARKEFRYVAYVREQIYCYKDEKFAQNHVDFKQKAIEFEARINDQMSDEAYFSLLAEWAGLHHDGHVNAMLGKDLSSIEFFAPKIRFEVLEPGTANEQLVVATADNDSSNLKPGAVVTEIQGRPAKEWMDTAEKYTSGSTKPMRRLQTGLRVFRALLHEVGPLPIQVTATYNGKSIQEEIQRDLTLFDGPAEDPEPTTGIEMIKSSILPGNIGYLRIDGFGGSKMEELLTQALDRLTSTNGLLIDVRKNGGGDQSARAILSRLAATSIVRYFQSPIKSDYLFAVRPSLLMDFIFDQTNYAELKPVSIAKSPQPRYEKPVMVLTSPNCFSACDTFVSAFKENKLGEVIGEDTGGGTGTPQVFELPVSGHKFRYSVIRGYTAISKTLIEGVGTKVDFAIVPTVEERVEKKDLQLQKAVNYLASKLTAPAPPIVTAQNAKGAADAIGGEKPLEIVLPADLLRRMPPENFKIPADVQWDLDRRMSNAE